MFLRTLLLIYSVFLWTTEQANAQQLDFSVGRTLVVDTQQLFNKSQFGIRAVQELEIERAQLIEENDNKVNALAAEEKKLTALRATMGAEEFRILADKFDQKVQATRQEQLAKTQTLNSQIEIQRVIFLNAATPILQALMLESGATVLLESRNVIFRADQSDITSFAIGQIDAALGDGSQFTKSVD